MNLENIDTEVLKNELIKRGYIDVFWNREDIVNRAEVEGVKLTDEEVNDIIYNIEQTFDANIGVNWDVISNHIRFNFK